MSITEFAALQLKEPGDPRTKQEVISLLRTGSTHQAAWSGYPVLLLTDYISGEADSKTRNATIYLIAGWSSVEDHHKWIASPKNEEVMQKLGPLVEVTQFFHLDCDFDAIKHFLEGARGDMVAFTKIDTPSEQALGGWTLDRDEKVFVQMERADKRDGLSEYAVDLGLEAES
ncbi:hypothetical protein FRC03_009446 [Tulasnella sp. 419]|nr:hypothetical protein FRC02_005151 [Tulasnella sp. 418]KAG8958110.1 hypothetical protein FRC03_009446 [Tulasnella sp. 419]